MVGREEPLGDSKPVRLGSLAKPEPGVKRLGRLTKVGDLPKPVVKQEPVTDGASPGPGVTRGGIKKTKFEPKIPQRRVKKAPAEAAAAADSGAADEEWTPQSSNNPSLQQRRLGAAFQAKGSGPAARVAFGAGAIASSRFSGGEGKSSGGGGGSKASGPPRNAKGRLELEESDLFPDRKKEKKAKTRPRLDLTSYYPVTLPSGPAPDTDAFERMDIDGESQPGTDSSQNEAIQAPEDEDRVPAAQELDLDSAEGTEKLLFFQLPAHLPIQSALGRATGGHVSDEPGTSNPDDGKGGGLCLLPEGYMGKLVVYKSGKVKLRLGDVLLDAIPGAKCKFYQEVAALDVGKKECHILGSVQQRVVLTPDIDHLLAGVG